MLETVFVGSRTDMFRKGVPDGRSDDWECSLNEPRPYLEYITWRNDLTLLWNWMMALSWHTHWAGDARILTFHPPKIMPHTAQNEDHRQLVLTVRDTLQMDICRERPSWILKFVETILWNGSTPNPAAGLSVPSQEQHPHTLVNKSPAFATADLGSSVANKTKSGHWMVPPAIKKCQRTWKVSWLRLVTSGSCSRTMNTISRASKLDIAWMRQAQRRIIVIRLANVFYTV